MNQAGMFSGLATGQMPVLITGKGNFIHPAGAFCGFGFAKQRPDGRCAKRQATAYRAFAKIPNNRTCVRYYTLKLTNTAGMFSGLPKRANAGPL